LHGCQFAHRARLAVNFTKLPGMPELLEQCSKFLVNRPRGDTAGASSMRTRLLAVTAALMLGTATMTLNAIAAGPGVSADGWTPYYGYGYRH
jgi:hypothetical protein